MTEASRDKDTSAEQDETGPDYLGYYTREVGYLLSQTEDCLPYSSQTLDLAERTSRVISETGFTKHIYTAKEGTCSSAGALFCDAVGADISDFKKERLNALLRQSVPLLTQEIVELEEPVIALHRIQRFKEKASTCPSANCEDIGEKPHKRFKLSSSSSSIQSTSPTSCNHNLEGSINGNMHSAKTGKAITSGVIKSCSKSFCEDCEIKSKEGNESHSLLAQQRKSVCESKVGKESHMIKEQKTKSLLDSNLEFKKEEDEVNDDLQLLLKTQSAKVEETMKKKSDELFETLERKKQKLEHLLDTIMSNCRPMTLEERQQLRNLIWKLPPKNLNRVVELIKRSQPSPNSTPDEIFVDLQSLDNTTLWRLYYYVQTFENARKLSVVE